MIKPIVKSLKELRYKCELVNENDDIVGIVKDLEDTLATVKGYGLAAPQIGIKKQIAIVRYQELNITLINPIYLDKIGKYRFVNESCLSFSGLCIDTARWMQIIIEYGLSNDRKKYLSLGLEAAIIQHEIDHLNGILIYDKKWKAL